MIYKGNDITTLTLQDLKIADWELAGVEEAYLKSLKHPRFEKIKPKPEMSENFKALRKEVKAEIEKRKKNV